MKLASRETNRLRMIRNIVVLVLGLALVGIGFWSLAYTTQSYWYVMTDFAGGLAMIVIALIWSMWHRRTQSRTTLDPV